MSEQKKNQNKDIVDNIYFKDMINDYYSINNNNPFINNILDIFESSIKKELIENKISSTNMNEEINNTINNTEINNKICVNESNNKINNTDNFSISKNLSFMSESKNFNNNKIIRKNKEYLNEKLIEFKENIIKELDSILKKKNKENSYSELGISCFNFSYYNIESNKNFNSKIIVPQINKKNKKRNYSETNSSKSDLKNLLLENNTSIQDYFKKIPKNY